MSRELLYRSLEAMEQLLPDERDLNHGGHDARDVRNWRNTVTALRAALAAPGGEAVLNDNISMPPLPSAILFDYKSDAPLYRIYEVQAYARAAVLLDRQQHTPLGAAGGEPVAVVCESPQTLTISGGAIVRWATPQTTPLLPGTKLYAAAQQDVLAEEKYNELIMTVGNKYPGETRHETALRYIRQAEKCEARTPGQSVVPLQHSDSG